MKITNSNQYQRLALRTEWTPDFLSTRKFRLRPLKSKRNHLVGLPRRDIARLIHGMLGACTEVGELQDAMKKSLIYAKDFDRVNIVEECGDILWYVALCLDAVGAKMDDAMGRNIKKLSVRFPKNKFTQARAKKRDLRRERRALGGASSRRAKRAA